MQFSDIIGQQQIKQHLVEMVQQNRLSHALLFLGKEGSGALPLALAFAELVILQPNTPAIVEDLFGGFSALEATSSFVGVQDLPKQQAFARCQQMMHPDIHFTYPTIIRKGTDKPKSTDFIKEWRDFIKQSPYGNAYDWLQSIQAENKQGNISADECNDLIKKLSLKSFESEYKVLVLWMPEYLGKEGNKLLKLIEEPPPNTLFILVAENEEHILPTILSRCQLVKIPSLDTADIKEALIERANANEDTATQIAAFAEGNYREALQLLQHNQEDWQSLLREWLNAILKGGPIPQVKFVDEISKIGREKQKQFLRYFNHLIEQSIRLKILGADSFAMATTEQNFALSLNKVATVSKQQAIIVELDKASYYIERNANSKMLFQALTLKIFYIIKNNVVLAV